MNQVCVSLLLRRPLKKRTLRVLLAACAPRGELEVVAFTVNNWGRGAINIGCGFMGAQAPDSVAFSFGEFWLWNR